MTVVYFKIINIKLFTIVDAMSFPLNRELENMLQYDKNILTKQQAVCHEATTT
jgi:hypothetical protein